LYVEHPLHSWNEAYLVVLNNLFDVLLNSFCHYFIEDFCINGHSGDWPIVLSVGVFTLFWDKYNTGFIKWVSISWNRLSRVDISSSLMI
jgi:hypothetical protein